MGIALAVFLLSLAGIIFLFAFKHWEERRGRIVAPLLRSRADLRAVELKGWLDRMREQAQHLLPIVARFSATVVHVAVLSAARAARSVERELHRLADMVSHKRGFQPRETQNEFLKQVSDHKNGTGDTDTTTV